MIICINIDRSLKEQMDQLVKAEEYSGYSDLVAIALANQFLLHGSEGQLPVGSTDRPILPRPRGQEAASTQIELNNGTGQKEVVTPRLSNEISIPEVFRLVLDQQKLDFVAPTPDDAFALGMEVPVDRWIFGQHNKLLPAKANVRALANLLRTGSNHEGLTLQRASTEIAAEAVRLGEVLRRLDSRLKRSRDEALATAFPSSDPDNSDKSRLRYGSQFVGAISREGRMTGLLVDLKLVNHDRSKSPKIQLTEQGWSFAMLHNPIIDGGNGDAGNKFSTDETEFMIEHIASHVPVECFAFEVTLAAITSGNDTPESLDAALKKYLPDRSEKPFTDAFLTTQRAGVISRMADLGLVARSRTGPNVTYIATARGKQFIEKGQ